MGRPERRLIGERLKVTSTLLDVAAEAIRWFHQCEGDPERFRAWLAETSWRQGKPDHMGSFKDVYFKRDLVLKFDSVPHSGHTKVEARVWASADRAKRQHLAQVLHHTPGALVQERVPARCQRPKCEAAGKLAQYLQIMDWDMNHSHWRNGRVVFFDYDDFGGEA